MVESKKIIIVGGKTQVGPALAQKQGVFCSL